MQTLVTGDGVIPVRSYVAANSHRHGLQQVMEVSGTSAAEPPPDRPETAPAGPALCLASVNPRRLTSERDHARASARGQYRARRLDLG